jgi:hypothetical protein
MIGEREFGYWGFSFLDGRYCNENKIGDDKILNGSNSHLDVHSMINGHLPRPRVY